MLHSVDEQVDAPAVQAQFDELLDTTGRSLPAFTAHLDDARIDLLAITGFRQQIWSTPTNASTKRSAAAPTSSGPSPPATPSSDSSALSSPTNTPNRLVGAVLADQHAEPHEEWIEGRCYFALDIFERSRTTPATVTTDLPQLETAA